MSTSANKMWYAGICRICKTGPLGIRTCGGCGNVMLLCDECDAVWETGDVKEPPAYANDAEVEQGVLPCPQCQFSLIDSPSHWATLDEIEDTGWIRQRITNGLLTLEQGEAFQPNVDGESA